MSKELEILRAMGCDVNAALERCVDDEEFYLECVNQSLTDEAFESLGAALQAHEVRQAFEYAHTLKGLMANMGLTPIYNEVVKLVEPLRAGTDAGLEPIYREMIAQRDGVVKKLAEG